MLMDNVQLSKIIREKKKKMMNAEPELVDSGLQPDLNPIDVFHKEQMARVEETLMSPPKINADDTMMNESYDGVGLSPEEKTRMGRLRSYLDSMDLSGT